MSSKMARAAWNPCRRAGSARSRRPRWLQTKSRNSTPRNRSDEFLDVLANKIGFQVHRITLLALAHGGHVISVGDDPNLEPPSRDLGHRKTDAIHRDGAFENNVAHQSRRGGNLEHVILPCPFPPADLAQPVDVTADEMSPEPAVGRHRSLEIHQ